jgi:DNA repair protein RecN (Recombination protein N)
MIEATFTSNSSIDKWLASQEIEFLEDHNFVCSREITTRSNRTRLNGVVVNKTQIQELREQLVEITAQGQTSLIGKEAMQASGWIILAAMDFKHNGKRWQSSMKPARSRSAN